MEKPKLAYVAWLDINTNCEGPWGDPDVMKPSECFSFGWLLSATETHVTISATYSDHDAEDGGQREGIACSAIPRGCITKLEIFTLETLLAQRQ